MKLKYTHSKSLLLAFAPLALASLQMTTTAQDAATESNVVAPDDSALLKKGNTWTYGVSVQIPDGVKFESTLKDTGEKTKNGMTYRYEEIQQSTGLNHVEALERQAPVIDIYIDGKLTKKQILEYKEKTLLYYGTYYHDSENPDLKKGTITVSPIILYSELAKVADKWAWSSTGLPDFKFRIISKDTEVEVGGKKYTADKILMDQVHKGTKKIIQSKEIWFAKDIGIVREREKSYVADGKAIVKTLELKSFANNPLMTKIK